uniref:Uncharacterized protein n=1 Tax=Aegilops tauschii TaxID=37682 RepID=M8CS51_AEGTA
MGKERLALTLERYHRFFVDPYATRLTTAHLNNSQIMDHMVGQVDLKPPRRSTLHAYATGTGGLLGQAESTLDFQ